MRVKGCKANSKSFCLTFLRLDIPEGVFGHVAPYWCDHCGATQKETKSVCTFRGSREQPAEYEDYCPNCGRSECHGENQQDHRLKLVQRSRAVIRRLVAV